MAVHLSVDVMSFMMSYFVLAFSPLDVLDEIIQSVELVPKKFRT